MVDARESAQLETDVLIMGAGLAGYSAALAAAEEGAEVIIVEKTDAPGGSTVMSGGSMAFAGTDMQRNAGIDDSAERLRADLLKVGFERNDLDLVDLYVSRQLKTYEWMKSIGVEFVAVSLSGGQSAPRSHTPIVQDMIDLMDQRATDDSNITVIRNAPAVRLLTDQSVGCHPVSPRVCGAVVAHEGKERPVTARKGTILATGGFLHNKTLMRAFSPTAELVTAINAESHEGDGLKFGLSVGSGLADMGTVVSATFGVVEGDGRPIFLHAMYQGAIIVDSTGSRFIDESQSYRTLGKECLATGRTVTFQIFDSRIFAQSIPGKLNNDFEAGLAGGYAVKAESLEELAEAIGVDPDALLTTVNRYNDGVHRNEDSDFGRTSQGGGAGELVKIEEGPFYAIRSLVGSAGTMGGLTVDESMRVRDVYGEPIDGLFAAGEVIGGLHGGGYMSGTALGKAAIFGRVAGQTSASLSRSDLGERANASPVAGS